jgi:hypothetical protein
MNADRLRVNQGARIKIITYNTRKIIWAAAFLARGNANK